MDKTMNSIPLKMYSENPFKPLADIVHEYILNEIIDFNYLPGTKLIESKLAKTLGVSRTPVRDAINQLEKDGFVIKTPGKGAVIAPFNAEDYFDLNSFRYVLEPLAAGYAALRITEKELGTLYHYTVALDEAYQSGDYKNVFSAENTFHEYIVLCSKNKYLIDAYKNIEPQMKRYRVYITADKNLYGFLSKEHYYIYQSIELRNKEVAEAASRRHISLLTTKSRDEIYNDNTKIIQDRLRMMDAFHTTKNANR